MTVFLIIVIKTCDRDDTRQYAPARQYLSEMQESSQRAPRLEPNVTFEDERANRSWQIDQDSGTFEEVTVDVFGLSAEGGELAAWFSGERLVRLQATFYGEMGKSVKTFYRYGDEPLITLQSLFFYDKPISRMGSKIDSVAWDSCFYDEGLMRTWHRSDGEILVYEDPGFPRHEYVLSEEYDQYSEAVRKAREEGVDEIELVPLKLDE